MFAGEGTPERTNKRFHYLSKGQPAKRLSTAFDWVTLYGGRSADRQPYFRKGRRVRRRVATLDDMKGLYDGFDLGSPTTSVSMTINGPAPTMLAFFINTVDRPAREKGIDQAEALRTVRGTIQADILKEDQGQNTSFLDRVLAAVPGRHPGWFIEHGVRNFYSVSISGYHIAEAGANPISQWRTRSPTASPTSSIISRAALTSISSRQPVVLFLQRARSGIRGDRSSRPTDLGSRHAGALSR